MAFSLLSFFKELKMSNRHFFGKKSSLFYENFRIGLKHTYRLRAYLKNKRPILRTIKCPILRIGFEVGNCGKMFLFRSSGSVFSTDSPMTAMGGYVMLKTGEALKNGADGRSRSAETGSGVCNHKMEIS